jgi:hypothetical protein
MFINKKYIIFLLLFLSSFIFAYKVDFSYDNAKLISEDSIKKTYKKKDGTIILKYADRDEAVFKDKTKIIKYKNGNKIIHTPRGVIIHHNYDSSRKYIYPNGKVKEISMDGKTPYGTPVKEFKRMVYRTGIRVDIIYSKKHSDDNMSPLFKQFYRKLENKIQGDIYKLKLEKNKKRSIKFKLFISNCRFAKTGYCRRKNKKEIELILYKNDKVITCFAFQDEELYKKDNYIKLVNDAVDVLFKKGTLILAP